MPTNGNGHKQHYQFFWTSSGHTKHNGSSATCTAGTSLRRETKKETYIGDKKAVTHNSHTIHVWYYHPCMVLLVLITYIWLKFMVKVGIGTYTSPMDPTGFAIGNLTLVLLHLMDQFWQTSWCMRKTTYSPVNSFCDLFGMASSRDPFTGCWWPPTFVGKKVTAWITWGSTFQQICRIQIFLVGGWTNPFEKKWVNLDHLPK